MTINRLHIENGYPVDLQSDLLSQIARAAIEWNLEVEPLAEGDYRLTPEWWTKHNLEHKCNCF